MKVLCIILPCILASTIYSFAQKPIFETLWASKDSIYLRTLEVEGYPSQLIFEKIHPKFGNIRNSFAYKISGDKLLLKSYMKADTGVFMMDSFKKGELTLTPINAQAVGYMVRITLAPAQKQYRFKDITTLSTDTVRLEKLLFKSTNCYGFCPAITLEIDRNRYVKYIGGKFAFKQGQYTGQLSTKLYAQLISSLKKAELDKLIGNNLHNADTPDYTIEVHYNHKVLYINSMDVPFALEPLKEMLMDMPRNIQWTPDESVDITFIK